MKTNCLLEVMEFRSHLHLPLLLFLLGLTCLQPLHARSTGAHNFKLVKVRGGGGGGVEGGNQF